MKCAILFWNINADEFVSFCRKNTEYEIRYTAFSIKDLLRPVIRTLKRIRNIETAEMFEANKLLVKKLLHHQIQIKNKKKIVEMYKKGLIDRFFICYISDYMRQDKLYEELISAGVKELDIWYVPINTFKAKSNQQIVPYNERSELKYLEFHLADHCNLNCAHCTMFSGLVSGEKYADFNRTKEGMEKLSEFINHIRTIRLMGGEPLLSPILADYLFLVRKIYPYSEIRIVTNGILIRRLNKIEIEAIKATKAIIDISFYPPMKKTINEIIIFLKENQIEFRLSEEAKQFRIIYDVINGPANHTKEENFAMCTWKNNCVNLHEHQLATCFVPFVIPYLSDHFNLKIKVSGTIDLFDKNLTTKKLLDILKNKPLDLCQYCAVYQSEHVSWKAVNEKEADDLKNWSL